MNPQRTEGEGFERQTWLGLHDQNISSSRAPSISQTRAAAAGPTPLPAAVSLPKKAQISREGGHGFPWAAFVCVCVWQMV